MPHGALLDPSNRLLGGATGDFSLYGALPAVTIGAAQPPAADPTLLTIRIATPDSTAPATAVKPAVLSMIEPAVPNSDAPDAPLAATLQGMQTSAAFAAPNFTPQVVAPAGSAPPHPLSPIPACQSCLARARTMRPPR